MHLEAVPDNCAFPYVQFTGQTLASECRGDPTSQPVKSCEYGVIAVKHHLAACVAVAAASFLGAPQIASAQSGANPPAHVPLQKTIGQSKSQVVPSLFVLNARGASLQGGKLVLTGVAPNSIVFADRP